MAAGTEVRLEGHGPAIAGDGEAELGLLAGAHGPGAQADVMPRGGPGGALGGGKRLPVDGAVDPEVGGERVIRALALEVGVRAVAAGLLDGERRGPRAVGVHGRVQV